MTNAVSPAGFRIIAEGMFPVATGVPFSVSLPVAPSMLKEETDLSPCAATNRALAVVGGGVVPLSLLPQLMSNPKEDTKSKQATPRNFIRILSPSVAPPGVARPENSIHLCIRKAPEEQPAQVVGTG